MSHGSFDRSSSAAVDTVAESYERRRPEYPPAIVEWLGDRLDLEPGTTVLDLAAGTGKFTRSLVTTGARVIAVEPLDEMRAQLEAALPGVEALAGTAEAIPLPDESVDAVTAAAAFHWFDTEPALAEIHESHRVLRCSFCAHAWELRTFACVYCGSATERFVTFAGSVERPDLRV